MANAPIDEGDLMRRLREKDPDMYGNILDLESNVYLRHDKEMLEIAEIKRLVMSGDKAGARVKLGEIQILQKIGSEGEPNEA